MTASTSPDITTPDDDDLVRCRTCGRHVYRDLAKWNSEFHVSDQAFCCVKCMTADDARYRVQPSCLACRVVFDPTAPGTAGAYCTTRCKRDREKTLKLAAKELARRSVPDDVGEADAMIERARELHRHLTGGSDYSRHVGIISPSIPESGPDKPVPGAAFTALRRRIDSLESEREALNHQLARQQERDVQTALAREAAKRAAEAQEAETAWRAEFDAGHIL